MREIFAAPVSDAARHDMNFDPSGSLIEPMKDGFPRLHICRCAGMTTTTKTPVWAPGKRLGVMSVWETIYSSYKKGKPRRSCNWRADRDAFTYLYARRVWAQTL